jgi:hypothetical protein
VGEAQPAGRQALAADAASRRFRLASPATATALGVLLFVLAAASVVLAGLSHQLTISTAAPPVIVILIYAGVGVVVARHQPRNPVPLWVPAVALFALVILLFPDGRLASRRWRWVLWAYAGLVACAASAGFVPAIAGVAGHDIRLDSFGDVTSTGHPASGAVSAAEAVVVLAIGVIWLSFVARQVLSWRQAAGERRQQLKWLACGAGITLVLGVLGSVFNSGILGQVLGVGIAALPVSIGVGILRYRLYDIDRIISRTLAYSVVTGLLVGVYAGLVLLATQVFGVHTPVAVAAATLAAAALFNPVRRRVQQAVDRRFNRARYDANTAITAFAAHVRDAVDLDAVRADLLGVVQAALEPAHASVWISQHN